MLAEDKNTGSETKDFITLSTIGSVSFMCVMVSSPTSPVGTAQRWVQVNTAHTADVCHGGRTQVEETIIFLKRL